MNTAKNSGITRRTALKGLGTAIALPWLESLALAAPPAGAPAVIGPPRRLAFVYVPNGANMVDWTPTYGEGKLTELPAILKPLEGMKEYFNIVTGMTLDK